MIPPHQWRRTRVAAYGLNNPFYICSFSRPFWRFLRILQLINRDHLPDILYDSSFMKSLHKFNYLHKGRCLMSPESLFSHVYIMAHFRHEYVMDFSSHWYVMTSNMYLQNIHINRRSFPDGLFTFFILMIQPCALTMPPPRWQSHMPFYLCELTNYI